MLVLRIHVYFISSFRSLMILQAFLAVVFGAATQHTVPRFSIFRKRIPTRFAPEISSGHNTALEHCVA
jgi:hypothetical protein